MSVRDIAPLKYIVAYCPLNSSSITKAMYALNRSLSMQRSLRLSLSLSCVAALALAGTPFQLVSAQEDGSADDFGVMSISLKDVVKPALGFQGALQGAGTPNEAGIGGFLPISVGDNSVFFSR